ncbi:MAG: hypothetical protein H0W78_07190 [Planctomycetes bacterium]|nr:hypothetical protein [Planctomycetota bacterium]
MTDEAHDYIVFALRALYGDPKGELPSVAELCWRSGSSLDPGEIETFGICCGPSLDHNTLETFVIEGLEIQVPISLQDRYGGRLMTVGTRRDPMNGQGGRVRELYFL